MAMPLDSMLEDIMREMDMFYMSEELVLHEKHPCHGDIGDGDIDDDGSDSDDNNNNDEGTIVEHNGCNHDALHVMVKCNSGDADEGMLGIIKVMGKMLEGMVAKNYEILNLIFSKLFTFPSLCINFMYSKKDLIALPIGPLLEFGSESRGIHKGVKPLCGNDSINV